MVIVTIGRADKLAASLAALERLDPSTPPFEVVVVLDGASPAAFEVASVRRRFPVRVIEQEHSGIGRAKNTGARSAEAPYIVFLNDDTSPAPGCLLAHLRAQHDLGPCIVIGHVDWDPRREITPYMFWLAPAGHLFNFRRLTPLQRAGWDACWGAHLGVPREWVLDEPFDPSLPFSFLEDGEWAYRQTRRGRALRYVPDARCLHDHHYGGPDDFRPRARAAGAAARYVACRRPRLLWPLALRPALAAVARLGLAAWPGHWRRATMWDLDFRWNFVVGLLSAQRRHRLARRKP